jgi:hypothetical protein
MWKISSMYGEGTLVVTVEFIEEVCVSMRVLGRELPLRLCWTYAEKREKVCEVRVE